MKILLIEPYFTGSHAAWAAQLARFSRHNVQILKLSGHYWKWRMHGGAVTLARKFNAECETPDLMVATDMLDLTTFLSLTRNRTAHIPVVLYMHENQLNYPWSPTDRDVKHKRDNHYSFINFVSALTANAVCFNSHFHLSAFFQELPRFLKGFPDHNELAAVQQIRAKSKVLPLGLDLRRFEEYRPSKNIKDNHKPPLILWNHRWEYDKNPSDFFNALYMLADEGLPFEVAILGENFRQQPDEFEQARTRLGKRVVQYGHAPNFADYARWLWQADILPVTSRQDFFGISAVQAIYCGCYPILPNRLAFPEHFPAELHPKHYYDSFEELVDLMRHAIVEIKDTRHKKTVPYITHYDWKNCIERYDSFFHKLLTNKQFKSQNNDGL